MAYYTWRMAESICFLSGFGFGAGQEMEPLCAETCWEISDQDGNLCNDFVPGMDVQWSVAWCTVELHSFMECIIL